MNCRHCAVPLKHCFLDLGNAPPSNAYLARSDLDTVESYYPLRLFVCDECWLVQTEDHAKSAQLFTDDYAYFSSVSQAWLEHAACYARMITQRLALGSKHFVIEIASNDGYMLRNFRALGIPCLGIEPTAGTAAAAEQLGIPVLRKFFDAALAAELASQGRQADLVIGNNVYAHVPDINDFSEGIKRVLKPAGCVTLEFPHLMRLIEDVQFDTVYHEHFSYLSLHVVCGLFRRAGLRVWDVEQLPTHGGSLRVYGCHAEDPRANGRMLQLVLDEEERRGLQYLPTYSAFQDKADNAKNDFLHFLIQQKREGKKVAAYGAAAKGNTLLNYAGVKRDLLPFVCDAAPAKQGKYMPGSHIPILAPEAITAHRPDYVVILPWNLADEIKQKNAVIREWGGRFVTVLPGLSIS